MIQKIKLGEKEYPVRWSFNALIKMEELLGESPFDLFQDKGRLNSPKTIRLLIYCGLYGGHRLAGEKLSISLEEVGDHIDFNKIEEYVEMFTKDILSQKKSKEAVVMGK